MGIRYYAYAFDADLAQRAVHDPDSILSSDPLADAWGLEPHASVSVATFEQVSPKRDMLYLDKAWSALQSLTRPMRDDVPPALVSHVRGKRDDARIGLGSVGEDNPAGGGAGDS